MKKSTEGKEKNNKQNEPKANIVLYKRDEFMVNCHGEIETYGDWGKRHGFDDIEKANPSIVELFLLAESLV